MMKKKNHIRKKNNSPKIMSITTYYTSENSPIEKLVKYIYSSDRVLQVNHNLNCACLISKKLNDPKSKHVIVESEPKNWPILFDLRQHKNCGGEFFIFKGSMKSIEQLKAVPNYYFECSLKEEVFTPAIPMVTFDEILSEVQLDYFDVFIGEVESLRCIPREKWKQFRTFILFSNPSELKKVVQLDPEYKIRMEEESFTVFSTTAIVIEHFTLTPLGAEMSPGEIYVTVFLIAFLCFVIIFVYNKIKSDFLDAKNSIAESFGINWGYKGKPNWYCLRPFCHYRPAYTCGVSYANLRNIRKDIMDRINKEGLIKTIFSGTYQLLFGKSEEKQQIKTPSKEDIRKHYLLTSERLSPSDFYMLWKGLKNFHGDHCEFDGNGDFPDCNLPLGFYDITGNESWFWEDEFWKQYEMPYNDNLIKPKFSSEQRKKLDKEYEEAFKNFKEEQKGWLQRFQEQYKDWIAHQKKQ